jgi:hypothetical protein
VLQGVSLGHILNKENCIAISENSTPIPPQFPPQQILAQQCFHPNHPQSSNLVSEEKNQINSIPPNQPTPPQHCVNQNYLEEERGDNLGVVGVQPDTASVLASPTGVELGVENDLIAMQNDLLTMGESNIAACEVNNDAIATPAAGIAPIIDYENLECVQAAVISKWNNSLELGAILSQCSLPMRKQLEMGCSQEQIDHLHQCLSEYGENG